VPSSLLLLVSFRNGDVAVYNVDLQPLVLRQQQQQVRLEGGAAAAAAVEQQCIRTVSHLRLPGPPAKLQLLQDTLQISSSSSVRGASGHQQQQQQQHAGYESLQVLAVSEGLWLLDISRHSHQVKLRHIAATPAVLAAALNLPLQPPCSSSSSSSEGSGQQNDQVQQPQQHIACVLPDGQLQLLNLPQLQQHKIQTWLPGFAVHELLNFPWAQQQQQLLLAQCSGTWPPSSYMQQQEQQQQQREVTWLQCLDAATGAKLAAYQPSGGQSLVCVGLWNAAADAFSSCQGPRSGASSSPEQQQQQQGLPGLHFSAPSTNRAAAAAAGAAAAADPASQLAALLQGLDSPGTAGARSMVQQRAAGFGQTWSNWQRAGPLVVLGTTASEQEDGCRGQVIVLQLLAQTHTAAAAAGISSYSFQRIARLRMPEPVTAVCGFSPELLLVAVGNVLAVYRVKPEQRGQLQQAAYCFTRASIVSLSAAGHGSGLVLAADLMQGLAAYQVEVQTESHQVSIQAVAAHDDVRPVSQVACLPPLPELSPAKAAAAAAAAAAAKQRTGSNRGGSNAANGPEAVDPARVAAVARVHGVCLDSRGYLLEVSWAKQRVVPVKCLSTVSCVPLNGIAAGMQVLPVAGSDSASSSSSADWFCRSLYALLDNEDIQLHWQNPLAAAAAANGASTFAANAFDDFTAGSGAAAAAAAAGSAVAAAGVAASSAIATSRCGAVLHLQKVHAQEGRLLLYLQQLLLQHPLTRGLCIGADHVLHEQLQLAGNAQAVPARLGAVDGRVLQQLLLLPGELQLLLLQSAGLGECLPGRLAKALQLPELQRVVLDAVLCRLQVLPCWD
jgi:hypothetical protein